MTVEEIIEASEQGTRFTVDGGGVAWYFAGIDEEPDEDTIWTGYEVPTGLVRMVMVGDDRVEKLDPDYVEAIPDDAYCRDCGQIGCTSNTYV